MQHTDFDNKRINGYSRIMMILVFPFIIVVLAYGAYNLFFIPDPVITGLEAFEFLPAEETVTVRSENVTSIDISIYQGGEKVDLLVDKPALSDTTYSLPVRPKELGLADGEAIVVVRAKSGFLKKIKHEIRSVIDSQPPTLEVLKAPASLNEGSSGVTVLRASGADAVYVKLNDMTFKAFESVSSGGRDNQPHPGEGDAKMYHVLFPAPFGIESSNIFYAIAEDIAGNKNIKALSTSLVSKTHRTSKITIDKSFIEKIVPPLLNTVSISDHKSAFRTVNEELRGKNHDTLIEIARNSGDRPRWKGRFLQLKNSKVMATYGDERAYFLDGEEVSRSVHLGYDLASFANAPVEAANSGTVLFAGDLGIYGNTVVIDHGLGLMSIYGHLSMMTVTENQSVKKGEIIAKSGATGLAGGDHLHYGILVHGYEVSPLYWWDPKWIDVNITEYLNY
jgi:murein DD-endopeptidase MepM/ murein hydrolase activator NlpD